MSGSRYAAEVSLERRLANLVSEAMGTELEFVAVTLVGRRVILHGIAPSYAAKACAVDCVRREGYTEVENCLRVVPGVVARPLAS